MLFAPAPGRAQAVARPDVPIDSVGAEEALSDARSAQRTFERLRRRWLPVTRSWSGSSCDEIVGRMCQNHDEGGDWWPGPEDARIVAARDELLAVLAGAAGADPTDLWVAGQRVVYLGEAGRWGEAEAVARACVRPEAPFCSALLGLSLHGGGRYRAAEGAFTDALAGFEEEERRRWTDPSVLLDGEGADWIDDAEARGPSAYAAALDLLWRLADPLWLVEGNDRLTEHWGRWTLARVRSDARNPHGLSWGRDLEELLVRYGGEIGWERTAPVPGLSEGVVGHQHPESRVYVPPGRVLEDPASLAPGRWLVHDPRPRTAYTPSYAPVVVPAEGEILTFPHPEGARLVASFALPEDTTRHASHAHPPFEAPPFVAARGVRAGLFAQPIGGDAIGPALQALGADSAGVLLLDVPAGRHVVGLEVWSPERGLAGRLRHGLVVEPRPLDVPTLSDLALLDGLLEADATLAEAVTRLRAGAVIRAGERIVVGWEVQGLGWRASEALAYRMSLTRVETGLLARVGRWLGIGGEPPSTTLSWSEVAPARPMPVFRSVELDVPEVEPGLYLLRLELVTAGRGTLVSERRLLLQR